MILATNLVIFVPENSPGSNAVDYRLHIVASKSWYQSMIIDDYHSVEIPFVVARQARY